MFAISQPLAATTNYLLVVPVGKVAHLAMTAIADTAGANKLELFPLVTTSADGTAFSNVFNKNSSKPLSASLVVTTAPTVTSTLDATTCMFSGLLTLAGMVAGSLDREHNEYILTAGKHLVRVTRAAGNITLQMQWYEEPA
jgi:hypothetical protein